MDTSGKLLLIEPKHLGSPVPMQKQKDILLINMGYIETAESSPSITSSSNASNPLQKVRIYMYIYIHIYIYLAVGFGCTYCGFVCAKDGCKV